MASGIPMVCSDLGKPPNLKSTPENPRELNTLHSYVFFILVYFFAFTPFFFVKYLSFAIFS